MVTSYFGQVNKAIVIEVNSEDRKVKIRIPDFHGPHSTDGMPPESIRRWVPDDRLPWAEVMYPVGAYAADPKLLTLGEVVYVIFTDTQYKSPLIIGTSGHFI